MPGKGELKLTGQLGDVMKESAMAGISYIRSVAEKYQIPEDVFQKNDFHIHIPEGAVPKDGPSAGITMATAMLSVLTDIPVKATVAMTGEITLRGRVLAIGGLKEKMLAAKMAGMKTVIVPKQNEKKSPLPVIIGCGAAVVLLIVVTVVGVGLIKGKSSKTEQESMTVVQNEQEENQDSSVQEEVESFEMVDEDAVTEEVQATEKPEPTQQATPEPTQQATPEPTPG